MALMKYYEEEQLKEMEKVKMLLAVNEEPERVIFSTLSLLKVININMGWDDLEELIALNKIRAGMTAVEVFPALSASRWTSPKHGRDQGF